MRMKDVYFEGTKTIVINRKLSGVDNYEIIFDGSAHKIDASKYRDLCDSDIGNLPVLAVYIYASALSLYVE